MSNKYTMDKLDEALWRGMEREKFDFYVANGRARLVDSDGDVVAKVVYRKYTCKICPYGICWRYIVQTRNGAEAQYFSVKDFFDNFPKDARLIILPEIRPSLNFSPFYGGSSRDYSSGPATMGF